MQGVKSLFHRVCVWVCLVGDWHDRAESVIQKSYLQILDTNPLSWTLILIPIPRSWSPLQTFRDLCISWFTAFQVPLSAWSDNKTIECHGGSGQNKAINEYSIWSALTFWRLHGTFHEPVAFPGSGNGIDLFQKLNGFDVLSNVTPNQTVTLWIPAMFNSCLRGYFENREPSESEGKF